MQALVAAALTHSLTRSHPHILPPSSLAVKQTCSCWLMHYIAQSSVQLIILILCQFVRQRWKLLICIHSSLGGLES